MMYPLKAEERWGFPENTEVKNVLWHVQVTQEAEDNCFIIHLGSSNTLSALPSSVPHPSCGLTFNIVSPGCGWLPVGPVHCHSETVSCAVCMPATCLPAPAACHIHFMRFISYVNNPGQSVPSSPTPSHSDWVQMGAWALVGLGGSLQPLGGMWSAQRKGAKEGKTAPPRTNV